MLKATKTMKQITLLAIVICMATAASANRRTIKDLSENWLQRENSEESYGSLRGGIGRDEDENEAGNLVVPVGEFPTTAILLLGCIYLIARSKKTYNVKR